MPETNTVITKTERTDGMGIPPPVPPSKVPPALVQQTMVRKKKRKSNVWLYVIAAVILLGAVWYFFFRAPAAAPVTVRYSAVDVGDISKAVTATGTLQATTTVQVGSQVSGTIKDLYADYNSHVTKGQLLAVLDPTFYQASVTQAQANLSKAEADLTNAQKDEARERDLLQRQLVAQADYDLSKNKLLDAQAVVAQMQAALKQSETNLGYTQIHSPISGVVVSRNVDKGQTVAASLNAPTIFVIAQDLSSMQVAANVDEADIGQVQQGQQVNFTVDAYPGEQFVGTVSQIRINPVTQQNVVTYTVIIGTNNPDGKLLPGMTATVNIINASKTGVLRVPAAALRFTPLPELFGSGARDSTKARAGARRQHAQGDTTRRGLSDLSAERVVFIKAKPNSKGAQIQAVRVVPGLSDGNYTEVVSSNPPLKAGDSVAVAAYSSSTTSSSSSPSSSPVGGMRGMGGGGRGGH